MPLDEVHGAFPNATPQLIVGLFTKQMECSYSNGQWRADGSAEILWRCCCIKPPPDHQCHGILAAKQTPQLPDWNTEWGSFDVYIEILISQRWNLPLFDNLFCGLHPFWQWRHLDVSTHRIGNSSTTFLYIIIAVSVITFEDYLSHRFRAWRPPAAVPTTVCGR